MVSLDRNEKVMVIVVFSFVVFYRKFIDLLLEFWVMSPVRDTDGKKQREER